MKTTLKLLVVLIGTVSVAWARQGATPAEQQLLSATLANDPELRAANSAAAQLRALIPSAVDLGVLDVITEAPSGEFYTLGAGVKMEMPWVYGTRKKEFRQNAEAASAAAGNTRLLRIAALRSLYQTACWRTARLARLTEQDSLLQRLALAAERRYQLGASNYLAALNGKLRAGQYRVQVRNEQENERTAREVLALYASDSVLRQLPYDFQAYGTRMLDSAAGDHPLLAAERARVLAAETAIKLARQQRLPSFSFGYLNQGPTPGNNPALNFRAGLSIPFSWWAGKAKVEAAQLTLTQRTAEQEAVLRQLKQQRAQALARYRQAGAHLRLLETEGLAQAEEVLRAAQRSFELGSDDFFLYLNSIDQAYQVQLQYLDAVLAFNLAAIELDYLQGL